MLDRQKAEQLKSPVSVFLTTQLADIVSQARSRSKGSVNTQELFRLINLTDSRGKELLELLEIASPGFSQRLNRLTTETATHQHVETYLNNTRTVLADSLAVLFAIATRHLAKPNIATDDLIAADILTPNSIIKQALGQVDADHIIRIIPSLSPMIRGEETGTVELIISPGSRPLDASQPRQTTTLPDHGTIPPYPEVVVRPKLVSELIGRLTPPTPPAPTLSILVVEEEELAFDLVVSTAQRLTTKKNACPVKGILILDHIALAKNPGQVIADTLNRATPDTAIYIPDLDQYLDHSVLTMAITGRTHNIIGSLTPSGWQELKKRSTFRRVKPLELPPYTQAETIQSLKFQRTGLETVYGSPESRITITDHAIEAAAALNITQFTEYPAPLGAKELIIQAANQVRIRRSDMTDLHDTRFQPDAVVDAEDVYLTLELLRGIKVHMEDAERYLQMETELAKEIIGQDEPIAAISKAVRRSVAGLKDPKQPIGAFIFLGPTGVGKTELSKAVSRFLFHGDDDILMLNMAEFTEEHTVSKLIGSPPGYKDADQGGLLTEAVLKKPYKVVVFDELEKAHPKVYDMLLNIIQEGELRDGRGKLVRFNNTVLIATSNIGARNYFQPGTGAKDKVLEEVRNYFRPELLNRMDDILVFNPLLLEHMAPIFDLQIQKLNRQLAPKKLTLKVTEPARSFIVKHGYQPEYGARPLIRAIKQHISDSLAEEIIRHKLAPGSALTVDLENEKIKFRLTQ